MNYITKIIYINNNTEICIKPNRPYRFLQSDSSIASTEELWVSSQDLEAIYPFLFHLFFL